MVKSVLLSMRPHRQFPIACPPQAARRGLRRVAAARIAMGLRAAVLALACWSVSANEAQGQILTFEFSAVAGNEATADSNYADANLNASTISRGAGLTASANAERFNATSWALTSIANAVSGNDYMEFTITPKAGYQFSVSSIVVQWQRSLTGNTAISLRSSVDAYSTDLDAVKSVTDNALTQTFTWTFAQANSSSPVTYRFYSYAEGTTGTGGPGDGAGNDIVVNGTVTTALPAISTSGTAATLATTAGTASASTSVGVTGTNLTASITATAPGGFEVSNNDSSWASTTTFTQTEGNASGILYARLSASAPAGDHSGNVTLASTGASTINVAVAGTVDLPAPTINAASATNVNSFTASWTQVTDADGYMLDVSTRSEFLPAGSTLLTNDFEGSWPPAGWITNAADQSGTYELSGTNSVRLNGADDYLITPLITRSAEFRAWNYRTSETPVLNVEQSASTNGPWVEVSGSPFGGATQQWNQCSAVLGNSTGVYLRFRRTGTGNVYLDDVHIASTQSDFVPGYDNRTVAGEASVSAVVTGLVSGTEYFYRVRAAGSTTTSANSDVQNVTTLAMPAPSTLAAGDVESGSFSANWGAVAEATGYRLDVSTNAAFPTFVPGYADLNAGAVASLSVTGLAAQVTYHYRVRAYDAGSTSGNSDTRSVTTTLKPEPSNHATGFTCSLATHRTIVLNWTDAAGGVPPDGYLVRASTNGLDAIPTPVDGQSVADKTDWSDGFYARKVPHGSQSDTLTGLAPERTYYVKLFPYANSAALINYKTGGSVPSLSATTGTAPFEDMEGANQLSYTTNTMALNTGNWLFSNALLGTTASDKRQDQKSARIQGTGLIEMQFDTTDVETLSLDFANFGADTGGKFVVEMSTDSGTNWNQLNGEVTCGATLQTVSTTIHRRGPVRFRIRMTGGTRINIDNIRLTPYEHPRSLIRIR